MSKYITDQVMASKFHSISLTKILLSFCFSWFGASLCLSKFLVTKYVPACEFLVKHLCWQSWIYVMVNFVAYLITQGSFCVWAQPMRGGVTMLCLLSLAEPIHRMIPVTVHFQHKPQIWLISIFIISCLKAKKETTPFSDGVTSFSH